MTQERAESLEDLQEKSASAPSRRKVPESRRWTPATWT